MRPEDRARAVQYAISRGRRAAPGGWRVANQVRGGARRKGVCRAPLFPRAWAARLACVVHVAVVSMLLAPFARADAQDTTIAAPRREASTSRHLLVGDLAFELRSPLRGTLSMGLADGRRVVAIDVRSTDARRWADSALRLLARRPPRPRRVRKGRAAASSGPDSAPAATRLRAILEEPGVGAGSMILTRTDSAGETRWSLYAADGELAEVRQVLEAEEARVLARVVRQGAIAAAPPALAKPKAKKRRLPAKPAPAVSRPPGAAR